MKKTTYISIAIALIVLSIAVPMAGAQVTVTTTTVRYRFASDTNVVTYYIPSLSGYMYPLAVFVRDGVLYVAYDNAANYRVVVARLDTGDVIKVCPYGSYDIVEVIIGGNGTAYAAVSYWIRTEAGWESGIRIVDLWGCDVIAEIGPSLYYSFTTRFNKYEYYMFMYDYYNNRLVYVYRNMTGSYETDNDNVVVIDLGTGDVRTIFSITLVTGVVDGVLIAQDYYYVNVYNASDNPMALYVYDARDLSLVRTSSGLATTNNAMPYIMAPFDYNRFGILYLKVIGEDTSYPGYPKPEFLRITMCDYGFNCVEYPSDLDNVYGHGVRAYKDVFVVASSRNADITVPVYASIFLPDKGLLINTTITGYAIPVDYNLWYSNRIVLYDGNGTFYVIDPPAITTTETQTMIQTVTVTTTTTTTETVTTTAAPYSSMPSSSSWLLLIILILIVLAITGVIKMASKSIIAQEMEFVKKK